MNIDLSIEKLASCVNKQEMKTMPEIDQSKPFIKILINSSLHQMSLFLLSHLKNYF